MSQNMEDSVKSFLRERLDGYKHPVKDDVWASIESRLPATTKRRVKSVHIITLISGIAAIFTLVLLFSDILRVEAQTEPIVAESHSGIAEPLVKTNFPETTPKYLASEQIKLSHDKTPTEKTIAEQTEQIDVDMAENTISEELPEPQPNNNFRESEINTESVNYYWETWSDEETIRNHNSNLSLALALNGALPDNDYNRERVTNMESGYVQEETTETDTKYDFPITAGVVLRYGLTKRLSLESGLNYTFLGAHDEVTNNGVLTSKSYYGLHYLGIPLRASYSIYDNRLFSVYLNAGVMAEKLISGKSETISLLKQSTETSNITTNRLQWSVSAALGISYKTGSAFDIFIEPGIGYYFDDGIAAPTIRRDRPFNFNLIFGLRISLN